MKSALRIPILLGGWKYYKKVLGTAPANLIAYWPLWDASGSVATDISGNALHGAYVSVTLGQPGIGDGRTCPLFDGINGYVNIWSAGLASAFNGAEGTLAIWCKVYNAGVWTDASYRCLAVLRSDGNNQVRLFKQNTDNDLYAAWIAGGGWYGRTVASGGPAGWFHFAITWDKAGDLVRVYFNGTQIGTDQTGLGTYAGAMTDAFIGEYAASDSLWNGYLAHAAIWTTPLSAAQIAFLANVPPPPILQIVVANPGFESSDMGAWDEGGSGTHGRVSTSPHSGSWCYRQLSDENGDESLSQPWIPVTGKAGNWKMHVWYKQTQGQGSFAVYDNTNSSWLVSSTPLGSTGGAWAEKITTQFTIPGNCEYITPYFYGGPMENDQIFWDDVSMEYIG